MNNMTLVNNASKLSIAPHPDAKNGDRQLALTIFIAIWILIFLIDVLLRCKDVLSSGNRRQRHLAPTINHNPPYEA